MKIFFLENDIDVFNIIKHLRNKENIVYHAHNLKDAACFLEFEPGVSFFDIFFFDVGLPAEEVRHVNNNKGKVTYNEPNRFNGLLFLLHNLDLLINRQSRVSIITAFRKQVLELGNIDVFGKNYIRKENNFKDENTRAEREQINKIHYKSVDTDQIFTFSFLDKGAGDIIQQINKFMYRG